MGVLFDAQQRGVEGVQPLIETLRSELSSAGEVFTAATGEKFFSGVPSLSGMGEELAKVQQRLRSKELEQHNLSGVGRIMNDNHEILVDMGLSHERLVYLCNKALALGACGAKVTGGGRGGFMLALTPGKDLQEKVARSFEAEGVPTIRATIGNTPTDETSFQVLK